MAKFEESRHSHVVHEIHRPQGHGYVDQKYGKGNLSPISAHVPQIDHGSMPGATGAGSPGSPSAEYDGTEANSAGDANYNVPQPK